MKQKFTTLDRVHAEYRDLVQNVIFDFSKAEIFAESKKSFADAADQGRPPTAHWIAPATKTQPAVDLYAYLPQKVNSKLPIIYFMHGGCYLVGTARQSNDALHQLAERHQAAVVSVEYRLATQAPFPADLHDAYHGLSFLYQNANQLNLDSEHMLLMGESAGGGLAARLALYTRDQGEFTIKGQVLIYPMLDHRTATSSSQYHNPSAGEFVWPAISNQMGWSALRGGASIPEQQLAYFSPSMATSLHGLPPTYLIVGDLDLFVNEDIDYANRLIEAGVPTELQVMRGLVHGFDLLKPDSEPTQQYITSRDQAIERMLLPSVK
ncbi:alpha/beta hydrolase [Acinetobacter ursingii]|uniref:alpha/beta hydrolase n=1 Tax=Acinetobacter ursingii TaxID=108980 RepID=UPI0021CD8D40|nr:alpha/beta hydrolase [Acinetobacter ursingii]MCU4589951.1 alpha/beta hydrolase [Acinetobacter ursingii]